MSGEGLVSVIIPTYYRNEKLKSAIESVEEQKYNKTEVIVVDGSEDGRAETVAEDHGATYIHQGEKGGAHEARSLGAEKARGEYINFLDDDDRMYPEKLERQIPKLEDDSTGVVYCGIEWESGHSVLPEEDIRGDVLDYALMLQMTPSSPSTMLMERDVVSDILPFQNLHGADDMGMKIELAKRTEFDFIDEPLILKGHSEDSLGGTRENIEGRFKLLERYNNLYDEFPDRVRRTAIAHTYLLDAEITLNQQLWSLDAIHKAAKACYHIPGWPISFVGYLGASIFGRPGRSIGQYVYWRFVLGDSHRGKLT